MANWDPSVNNGIAVWQISGQGNNVWVTLLDGNGYTWFTGHTIIIQVQVTHQI